MIYPTEAFRDPMFCDNVMRQKADQGKTTVIFDGPEPVSERTKEVPTRELLINILLWKPLMRFSVPITFAHYRKIAAVTEDVFAVIQTKQYHFMLDNTSIKSIDILTAMWDAINDVNIFAMRHLSAYQCSMSILSLSRVQCDPQVQAITSQYIDPLAGTLAAEEKHKRLTSELSKLISTRGALKNNVLLNFMEAGLLKSKQIPQQMLAYGTRSDIDDRMARHVINESAMTGLKSPADFAIEALSAKKSAFFNKTVIKSTQYFARVLRLNCSILPQMYMGHCGSSLTVPVIIADKDTEQYVDKVVFYEGTEVAITVDNHKQFANARVSMRSPLTCRYADGICEYCAGRATSRPWAFIPAGLHLGIYSATKVGKAVSQMVLSAKHLISTKSLTYALPQNSSKYFMVGGTEILFKEKFINKLDRLSLKISTNAIGHMADLTGDNLAAIEETFSNIDTLGIIDDEGHEEEISIAAERFMPFFSAAFLKHMAKHAGSLQTTDDDCIIIPLKGFNAKRSIMKYIVVNDDMVAFTRQVDTFLRSKIGEYTSLQAILHDFSKILYSKTKINVFFVEVLLKTFLRKHDGEAGLPLITDINNVRAGSMKDNIENASVSTKLAHERVGEYMSSASACVRNKGPGVYDANFGFSGSRT